MKPFRFLYIALPVIIIIITILAAIVVSKNLLAKRSAQPPPLTAPPPAPAPRLPPSRIQEPDDFRSPEVVNPSGTRSAYIEPLAWEECGNIFIKNTASGTTKQLTDYTINRENKPKQIAWFNDTLMLVIEGYTWGTVTVGGSLYFVNANTGKYTLIMDHLPRQEIAEVSKHKNSITLRIAIWADSNNADYTLHTRVLDADSVFKCLNK